MWKALSSRKQIWKRCRTDDAWTEIMRMWNSYHNAIKLIKNWFWTNFLNKIKEKKVFQTYKFIKSRLIEKLLSIQNAQKKLKTEFNKKCETFLKAMYSSSSKVQINENLLSTKVYSDQELLRERLSMLLTSQHSEKHSNQMICHSQSCSEHTKAYWKFSIWCIQIWLKETIIQRYDAKAQKSFWKNRINQIIQFQRHTELSHC